MHERSARPHPRADRRQTADRPRRHHRRAAGRRGVRLLHRAAGRHGLHHDAQVPPQHLPGGHRHAGSGAAREVPGHAGERHQLLLLHRRTGARSTWRRWASAASTKWSAASTCSTRAQAIDHWKAQGPRPLGDPLQSRRCPAASRRRCVQAQDHGLDRGARLQADRSRARSHRERHAGRDQAADPQRAPHRGRHAERRNRAALRLRRPARRHHPLPIHRLGRTELRRVPGQGRHARRSKATPTITSARDSPAAR